MPIITIGSVDGSQLSGKDDYVGKVPDQVLRLIDSATGNPNGLLSKVAYSVAERNAGRFSEGEYPRVVAGFAVFIAYGAFGGYEIEPRNYAIWTVERLAKRRGILHKPDSDDIAHPVNRIMEHSKDVIHPV